MKSYLIGRMEITDHEAYNRYKALTPGIISQYGGRFLTRGGEKLTLEGADDKRRVVIVEFDSTQKAREFYESPEYQAAIRLRENAANMELFIVGGFE